MSDILFQYNRVPPTTWVYLSSLLMVALFFKFNRLWSVRNLDLLGLVLLAPGLLLVEYGRHVPDAGDIEQIGFIWLFVVAGLFLVRLLVDPTMVRRPLLEPNMTVGGLTFLGVALLVFLMANVLTSAPVELDLTGAKTADQLIARQEVSKKENMLATHGPGCRWIYAIPRLITQTFFSAEVDDSNETTGNTDGRPPAASPSGYSPAHVATARAMAILSHVMIVVGMVLIGHRHFDNVKTGIAAALLYLMLPYTALMTGRVDHVLPAALLIWAIVCYRRPLLSGMFLGLVIGTMYYPFFLLPLWCSFYWQKGLLRFVSGVVLTLLVLVSSLALTASEWSVFVDHLKQMFGFITPWNEELVENLQGFWGFFRDRAVYRIPVLAAFVAMIGTLAIWPAQKNLGTLMSCSAAVMLGTQFWHAHDGGLYMAWYLPLMLLTIFRPNLEDRVALAVLGEAWLPKRLALAARANRAA